MTVGETRVEADQAATEKAILDYLATQAEAIEERAINENVECKKAVRVKALRRAVDVGKIARTGGGKRGDPYRYSVSGSLVPAYTREPEKREPLDHANHSTESTDAGSQLLAGSEQVAATREPAFSAADREEFEL